MRAVYSVQPKVDHYLRVERPFWKHSQKQTKHSRNPVTEPVLNLSQTFPETRKRHAAAYREYGHLVEYAQALYIDIKPISGGSTDPGR
jgi:hypothetical protein